MAARKNKGPFARWPVAPELVVSPIPAEGMRCTSCSIVAVDLPTGKTKALARVVMNEQLQLTGIRVIDGANGLFVAYPNDKTDLNSLFYPVTRELRNHIEEVVLSRFVFTPGAVISFIRGRTVHMDCNGKGELTIEKTPVPLEDLPMILQVGFSTGDNPYKVFYEQLAKQNGMS